MVLPGHHFVEALDSGAFNSTQLFNGSLLRSRFAKAHVVHLANDFEARVRVKGKTSLVKQPVGTRSPWLANGIESHAGLANPNKKTANARSKSHGSVRYARPRFQHQACQTTHGNVSSHSASVNYDKRAVQNIKLALFDEQNRGAILDGDWTRRRKAVHRSHNDQTRRISIRPQPYALAAPKPLAMQAKNCSGSRTSRAPSKSRVENDMECEEALRLTWFC